MLMQDGESHKRVVWMTPEENKKLNDADSVRDLVYKENPDPVVTHKSDDIQPKNSIMKVKTDPFYSECFPAGNEEQAAEPIEI